MATFPFKGPDGQTYDVNAPDGVSEAQAYEQFQTHWKKQKTGGIDPVLKRRAMQQAADETNPLVNIGAGMDTAWQGLKGLFGHGMSDAELRDKRERDQALADASTGGGVLQMVGEIAPTLAIPAGGFVRAGQAGLNLGRIAAGAAPKVIQTASRMGTGTMAADAALAGGALGAAQPITSDESRLWNTIVGSAGGALLPGLVATGRSIKDFVTRGGAQARAAQQLINAVGGEEEAQILIDKIRASKGHPSVADIPMTTAEVTQNPALARAQKSAQAFDTPQWMPFRAAQAEARYGALQDVTRSAEDLGALTEARDVATAPLREKALSKAGNDQWFHEPVVQAVYAMTKGGSGSDPAVQALAGYVERELGNGITPERLYTVRKVLADKLGQPGAIGDVLSAATKARKSETMALINSIDESLQNASGGLWKDVNQPLNKRLYMNEFSRLSRPVEDSQAAQMIRNYYEREGGPRIAGTTGSVPELTSRNLGAAMDKFSTGPWGDRLSLDTREGLSALKANLEQSDILQKSLQKTGTGGGGSNTMMDFADMANDLLARNRLTRFGQVTHYLGTKSKAMEAGAVSDALRNPEIFVKGIESKMRRNAPLTASEEAVLMTIRGAGGGAAIGMLGAQ